MESLTLAAGRKARMARITVEDSEDSAKRTKVQNELGIGCRPAPDHDPNGIAGGNRQ